MGWPVVTAENCFDVITNECGITPWPKLAEPEPINSYLLRANNAQKQEYDRFGPKSFLVQYQNPGNSAPFNGFRSIFKPYSLVFALIDGMVPVTAEWKHGNAKITIVPVCGVPGKEEQYMPTLMDQMTATAVREWHEETGMHLSSVVPLCPIEGIWSESRKAQMRCFPFLGTVKTPLVRGKTKLDDNETLAMLLFPLDEWLKLMESESLWDLHPEFGLEACARDATYAALRRLGRLKFA